MPRKAINEPLVVGDSFKKSLKSLIDLEKKV
jgi:hypothetical protein